MSKIVRKIISTSLAPAPIGPFSQAVQVDKTLYISGQVGMDAKTLKFVGAGVEEQARKTLENIGHVLKEAGASYNNVVKATVLLADINDFATVNGIYKEFFTDHFPARAAYQVAALPVGAKVEIEAVAVIGEIIELNKL